MTKGLKRIKRVVSCMLTLVMVFSFSAIPAIANESSQNVKNVVATAESANWTHNQTLVAYSNYMLSGNEWVFTRNRLSVSANATLTSGSADSVTVVLKKKGLIGWSTVSTSTLYINGTTQHLFVDVPITPNATYALFYQVNGDNASARITAVGATWQQD